MQVPTRQRRQPEKETADGRKKKTKKPGAGGGGGGPYRAFLHMNFKGRRMDAAAWSQAAVAYNSLAAEEKLVYVDIGQRALAAWRQGFFAFGPKSTTREALPTPVGALSESGAIVAQDAPRQHEELVPVFCRDLKEDLREITSSCRLESKKRRQAQQAELAELEAAERAVLEAEDIQLFRAVPSASTFLRGQKPEYGLQMNWFPPCAEMTQAAFYLQSTVQETVRF